MLALKGFNMPYLANEIIKWKLGMLFWNYHLGQKLNARVFFKSGTDEFQLLFKLCKCFIT